MLSFRLWSKLVRQPLFCLAACALAVDMAAASPWTKYDVGADGNPANDVVLQTGAAGSWDMWAYYPAVIQDGANFDMWYTGFDGNQTRIGLATSTDGKNWTKLGMASLGASPDMLGYGSSVIKEGATYKMWYGLNSDLAYATSSDGLHWTSGGTVLTRGAAGQWDAQDASWSSVVNDGGVYKMWYGGAGSTYAIGYAVSVDGINWTKQGMVLQHGAAGTWDSDAVNDPTVVKIGDQWNMWFHGADANSALRIGHATSPDGITWTADAAPVIDLGVAGAWDQHFAFSPSVLLVGNQLDMWYTGWTNNNPGRKIGLATSLVPEPSGALLLIFGAGLSIARLRPRRQRVGPTESFESRELNCG